jgi:hypothetical protein
MDNLMNADAWAWTPARLNKLGYPIHSVAVGGCGTVCVPIGRYAP